MITDTILYNPNSNTQQSILPVDTNDAMLIDLWLSQSESALTRVVYTSEIRKFFAFTGVDLKQVMLRHVQSYKEHVSSYAPATINKKLSVVKSLLTFGQKSGYLQYNVGVMVKVPKVHHNLANKLLTEQEIFALLHAVKDYKQDHAIIHLLFHAALRVSELCGLEWKDISERENGEAQLYIIGKGAKQRTILISSGMYQELLTLKKYHTKTAVFVGYNTGKSPNITTSAVQSMVAKTAILAGLERRVTPHMLRHSAASIALHRGCDLTVVRDSMGHSSIATTNHYLHSQPDDSLSKYLPI